MEKDSMPLSNRKDFDIYRLEKGYTPNKSFGNSRESIPGIWF